MSDKPTEEFALPTIPIEPHLEANQTIATMMPQLPQQQMSTFEMATILSQLWAIYQSKSINEEFLNLRERLVLGIANYLSNRSLGKSMSYEQARAGLIDFKTSQDNGKEVINAAFQNLKEDKTKFDQAAAIFSA